MQQSGKVGEDGGFWQLVRRSELCTFLAGLYSALSAELEVTAQQYKGFHACFSC